MMPHLTAILANLVFLLVGWAWYEQITNEDSNIPHLSVNARANIEENLETCNQESGFIILRDL